MQKLPETLSEQQRKLIEKSYDKIKGRLITYFVNKKNRNKIKHLNVSNLYEALSFLPDLVLEYKEEDSNGMSFENFAADRCIKRLIDEFRRMNKFLRVQNSRKHKVKKLQEEILSKKGFCSEPDLVEALGLEDLEVKKYLNLHDLKKVTLDNLKTKFDPFDDIEEIDTEDQIQGILEKSERYFAELPGENMNARNKLANVRKKLIKEYLIPLATGDKRKSLSDLANELDLSEGRLSQLLKDDSMKTFISSFYKEFDAKSMPVIPRSNQE